MPDSPWAGVVAVRVRDGTFSGALVHRRLVLTAAHVVAGAAPADVRVQVNLGPEPVTVAALRIHVHPGWRGFTRPWAYDDVALVELVTMVPLGTPIYMPYPYVPPQGTELTLVGYGASGYGDRGPNVSADPAVKRVGRNRIERVVPKPDAPNAPCMFLYDFDGPDEASNVFGTRTLGNEVETTVAGGDSGGPAFVGIGGFPRIAGVSTFAADFDRPGTPLSTFGSSGGGVLLASVERWLGELRAAVG